MTAQITRTETEAGAPRHARRGEAGYASKGAMPWEPIRKSWPEGAVLPSLQDHERARTEFSWAAARSEMDGLPGGLGLSLAHEAVARPAGPRRDRWVIRWIGKSGDALDPPYARLRDLTNQLANILDVLGVVPADRVYALAGRNPELPAAALRILKHRAVFCPLFSAFGPEPIRARMAIGRARVLVSTEALYCRKAEAIRTTLPDLQHVLLIGDGRADVPGTHDYHRLMGGASERYEIGTTRPEDVALLHFTSGTTGTPKWAVHVHAAVVAYHITGKPAHPGDVFWCTADPGWVTGTSYGIIAPLTDEVTSGVDEGGFDADRWYGILQARRVTVWYTAPTAIRMLMKAGVEAVRKHDLRFLASVGEPLNPEAVVRGHEAFGVPFHDNWWQTETGGIIIANFAALVVRPSSMGRTLPGVEAVIVRQAEDGRVEGIGEPSVQGALALRPGWPSMFRAHWDEPERYRKCFTGGFYLTGDLARSDADGYFWFVGRKGDVIKTSGHLVGPFEVESVLLKHPAVGVAGVIGKPDPVAGEIIKAFVALKGGHEPGEGLLRELQAHARKRLGAALAPKEIAFLPGLPRNRAGKIMRRFLRARELGPPEGDTSKLEAPIEHRRHRPWDGQRIGSTNTTAVRPRAGWSGGCSSTPIRSISRWPWPRASGSSTASGHTARAGSSARSHWR